LQTLAKDQRVRVTFVTGNVRCAAVGLLKTLSAGKDSAILPEQDHRYMLDVTTSERLRFVLGVLNELGFHRAGAIVNTP
jgi:hypothetical protein